MIKKWLLIFLLPLLFLSIGKANAFELRHKNDIILGITGGYSFPQVALASNQNGSSFSLSGKEYSIGLSIGYFITDKNALSLFTTYQYVRLSSKDVGKVVERFIHVNIQDEFYFWDFFYLALGGFISVPLQSGTYEETIAPYTHLTGGLSFQSGVNMRIWQFFSLRIALQVKIPFNNILSKNNNNISVYSMPIGLIFSLEYTI